jgi:nitric oxide reductase FlRd-NAD(+) reductase
MDEYNKPDLSHVISQSQRADDLTRQTAGEFAEQFNLRLLPHTWVTDIDAAAHLVKAKDKTWQYDKLVLATGRIGLCAASRGPRADVDAQQPAGVSAPARPLLRDATAGDDCRRQA